MQQPRLVGANNTSSDGVLLLAAMFSQAVSVRQLILVLRWSCHLMMTKSLLSCSNQFKD